jgi:hypothetical protein
VSNYESCSFLKKRTKRLLLPDAGSTIPDLAGEYGVYREGDDWEVGVSNDESFSARLKAGSHRVLVESLCKDK